MTTVTRYIGNCQICEGDFKTTPEEVVALHGYTRPGDGVVHGRCPGEGWAAYELGTNRIPPVIESYKATIADIDAAVRRIDAGEVTSFFEPGYRKLREVTNADPGWTWKLNDHRGHLLAKKKRAEEMVVHYQNRIKNWVRRPLREVDEEGRTAEQRQGQEARKRERLVAKQAKESKKEELAQKRGEILLKRKALLDEGGRLIREAAARGDKEAALVVLRELGKKKHASMLEPSFASDSVSFMKRKGALPEDLPDVGDRIAYHWETDLRADDAMLAFGLAEGAPMRGVIYKRTLWGSW